MRRCRDCEHCKNGDCHCPVPLAMDSGEYVLNQVNPTNPDRDASECTCFKKRIKPRPCDQCETLAKALHEAILDSRRLPRQLKGFIARATCHCGLKWGHASHRQFAQTEDGEITWSPESGFNPTPPIPP
jgi:hypothetical protein